MWIYVMAGALSFCIFRLVLFPGAGVRPLLMTAMKSEPALIGPRLTRMFQGPPRRLHPFCITCKCCGQTIAAPVQTVPDDCIIAECRLCGEKRRYLPAELFNGRLSGKFEDWQRRNPRK